MVINVKKERTSEITFVLFYSLLLKFKCIVLVNQSGTHRMFTVKPCADGFFFFTRPCCKFI